MMYKVKYIDVYAQYRSLSLDIQRKFKKINKFIKLRKEFEKELKFIVL